MSIIVIIKEASVEKPAEMSYIYFYSGGKTLYCAWEALLTDLQMKTSKWTKVD